MTSDAFAREWVQAWNRRDLESLLACFAEDVEFRSPLAAKLLGEPSGTVHGKANLREYFTKAFGAWSVVPWLTRRPPDHTSRKARDVEASDRRPGSYSRHGSDLRALIREQRAIEE